MEIISSLKFVDSVFFRRILRAKKRVSLKHDADCLVMGCDWTGKFDEFNDICEVLYLPRTPPHISTTEIIRKNKRVIIKYEL